MVEFLSWLTLTAVAVLLLMGLIWQFKILGPRGRRLDSLTILPQWKFFGQSRIATDPACFDDLCLLARTSGDEETPGTWQKILGWEDRPLLSALWNSSLHRRAIDEAVQHLATTGECDEAGVEPTSLAYLTVLRYCFDHLPIQRQDEAAALQFGIATTRGREAQNISLKLLSAWHKQ